MRRERGLGQLEMVIESEEALGVVPRKLCLAVLISELSKKSYLRRTLDLAGPLGSNSVPCSRDNSNSSSRKQYYLRNGEKTILTMQGMSCCSIGETLTAFGDQPMSCRENGQLAFRPVFDTRPHSPQEQ